MAKNEPEFFIRPVDKTDWIHFAVNSENNLDDDPFYQMAFDTLRQVSNIDVENSEVEKCYVAESNSNVLGFVYGFVLPNGLLIPEFVYVKPNYRKNGIAKKLLFTLEKESGCISSMIFYNKTLREHYSKLGYTVGDKLEVAMKELKGDILNEQNEI